MRQKTRQREVIDRKVLQGLLLAQAPLAPAPGQAAAVLKERVLAAVRPHAGVGADGHVVACR